MGCTHKLIYNYNNTHHTLHHFTISFLFLLISTSTQLSFTAGVYNNAGRTLGNPLTHSQEDQKMVLRGHIGSRPPRCERRCSSCGQCEAIQVPTDPQMKGGSKIKSTNTLRTIAYSNNSNYKPISWKCKCGSFIFNP